MYVKYGSYTHSPANLNAVNLTRMEIIPVYTPRNLRRSYLYRIHARGELIADTQAEISSLIDGLIAAYADNGKDWTLYQDDGTPTKHRLVNDRVDALSDVQVERREWPVGEPAEYATGRVFSLIMRQEVAAAESQILEYWETIRWIGRGGSMFRPVRLYNSLPVIQRVNVFTEVYVIQQGKVVALEGWPDIYVPQSYFPDYLTRSDMRELFPTFSGRKYTNYGWEWTYLHVLPSFTQVYSQTPDFRGVV